MGPDQLYGGACTLLAAIILWTIFGGSRKILWPAVFLIAIMIIGAIALIIAKEYIPK